MRMRTGLLALAAVSVLGVSQIHFCRTALGRSAHAFYQYFHALQGEPLNPVDRFVFSLMLANTKGQQEGSKPVRHGA
jgi:hypothetical protein